MNAQVEDYLKAIFALTRHGQGAASTSNLATQLGLAAGTVTGMVKRLAEQGLVEHEPYYGARLTGRGRREALRLVRRHRLIERFLVEVLGYGWDAVHEEAERLEHTVSDEMVDRMSAVMNHPQWDPHGAPIPEPGRPYHEPELATLEEVEEGARVVLRQVPDEDAAALRYLGELGLVPGAQVTVLERTPFKGPVRISIGGKEHFLGLELSRRLSVERVPQAPTKRRRETGTKRGET